MKLVVIVFKNPEGRYEERVLQELADPKLTAFEIASRVVDQQVTAVGWEICEVTVFGEGGERERFRCRPAAQWRLA